MPIDTVLVPPVCVNTTVAPPLLSEFPAESFACSVSVALDPDETVSLDVLTTDVRAEAAPALTATVGRTVVTGCR